MKLLISAAAAVLLTASQASALVIAAWDPEPTAGAVSAYATGPGAPAAGVTPGQLSRGPGLTRPTSVLTSSYNATGFLFAGSTQAQAVAAGDYFLFSFASTTAYDLDYLAIHYGINQTGPKNQAIELSVDGGATFSTVFTSTLAAGGSQQQYDIDLSGFGAVTDATFRLVGWNAVSGSSPVNRMTVRDGDDFIEGINAGIAIFGDATPPAAQVPLPAALPLLGVGLAALGVAARRRS